ncbi:P-loop NTPase fold protein [uncultured Methanobrevibacter sp.]|uniref:KAP family P-loop NTPase fold protein n=1 Tax=uncultured Methanobrevibacter sp. TaxID=253161 RepID=UPI0025F4969F|nr:P-loop NTPase fold protein [uncultured Methanobrevibacter sp.]
MAKRFIPDEPLDNKNDDKLNRYDFAENLADILLNHDYKKSLTIGLIGTWGSGKTSIINLALNQIEDENIIKIKFDSWNFSTQNNLYEQFFKLLISEIEKREYPDKFWFEKKYIQLKKQWKKSDIPEFKKFYFYYPRYAYYALRELFKYNYLEHYYKEIKSNSSINFGFRGLSYTYNNSSLNREYHAVSFLKKRCNDYINDLSYQFIIVIDDIDRMTDFEIHQIFILVKSLADFDNFVYIIPFDKEVVTNSLKKIHSDSSTNFIDKIIQIPVIVPDIKESDLDKNITEEIKPLYNEYFERNISISYEFYNLLIFIKPFIKNIRSLKKYHNTLNFYLKFIDDLNINDYIILILIQTFEYSVYLILKDNKEILLGNKNNFVNDDEIKNAVKKFWENIKNEAKISSFDNLYMIIQYLFPILNGKNGFKNYNQENNEKLDKFHNISSKNHFDKYFTLNLEDGEISPVVISKFIQLDTENEIFDILNSETKNNRLSSLLFQFKFFIEDIESNNIEYFIRALMKNGDQIYQNTTGIGIYNLFKQLFERLQSGNMRYNLLKESIDYENNTLVILEFLYTLSFDYGKDELGDYVIPENKMLISEKQYDELEPLLIQKIKTQLKEKKLYNHPNLGIILARLKYLSQETNFEKYMPLIKTDEEYLNFLKSFEYNLCLNDNSTILKTSLNFNDMEELFEIKNVIPKIHEILNKTTLNDENKKYCERFIYDYENKYNFKIKNPK